MLKLKLQYFGHLVRRVVSLDKTDAETEILSYGLIGKDSDAGKK